VFIAGHMLIQACLNGARRRGEHPALPWTPEQIAADAVAAVRAGAAALHVHPRRDDASESLRAEEVRAVCDAVRDACPTLRVGVTTAAWIEPDVSRRMEAIASWTVLPDFASVNLGEPGAIEVIELLNERGMGVEAGIWTIADARLLVAEGLDAACLRILVEVEAVDVPQDACALAAAIDFVLDDGLVQSPRLHHGGGVATWHVIEAAMERGHDVRIGLEDTLVWPDGTVVAGNAALVARVAELARRAGRVTESLAKTQPG
jgi:uncharacterized protein (DUF849 family)